MKTIVVLTSLCGLSIYKFGVGITLLIGLGGASVAFFTLRQILKRASR